jgi:integrase
MERMKMVGVTLKKSDVDEFIEILISNKVNEVVRISKAITDPLSDTANRYFYRWFYQTNDARYHNYNIANAESLSGYSLTNQYRELPDYSEWLSSCIADLGKNDTSLIDKISVYNEDEEQWEIDTDHEFYDNFKYPTYSFEKYNSLTRVINLHVNKISKAHKENNSARVRLEVDELKKKFFPLIQQTPPVTIIPVEKTIGPTYLELRQEYIAQLNKPLKEKGKCELHLTTYGADLDSFAIDEINTQNLVNAHNTLLHLPKQNSAMHLQSPYQGKSITERWEIAKDVDVDNDVKNCFLYSGSALSKYRTSLFDFFDWLELSEKISKNPAQKSYKSKHFNIPNNREKQRANFTDEQASKIINFCKLDLSNPIHWSILLMAYHGLRNSEVANLEPEHILTFGDSNTVCIKVIDGKTKAAKRMIPVHKDVLKLGFREMVDSCSNKKIFNFDSNKMTSYYYHVLRKELDLPDTSEEGGSLSLYSFRHCFVTKLSVADVTDAYKKYLIGHKDISTRYTHFNTNDHLVILQSHINKIKYQ